MKKHEVRPLFLLGLCLLTIAGMLYPSIGYCQTVEAHDQDCSHITEKDKAYVALADEFLLPTDVVYNTPSWRVGKVSPGVHWKENRITLDEVVAHRIGWTDGHVKFSAFGPYAGIDWIAYHVSSNASSVIDRFRCSGYELTAIEGPEKLMTYYGRGKGKKNFFIVEDGNLEAMCVTTGAYNYALNKQAPIESHLGEWCKFDMYAPAIKKYTP